jgi:hypothetical protein
MTRTIVAAFVALACVLGGAIAEAQIVPLTTLFTERARFAERPIVVVGTVGIVAAPAGGVQRFTLNDGGVTIDVVARGGMPVHPGNRVEVEGIYRLGPNLIEAFRVMLR